MKRLAEALKQSFECIDKFANSQFACMTRLSVSACGLRGLIIWKSEMKKETFSTTLRLVLFMHT